MTVAGVAAERYDERLRCGRIVWLGTRPHHQSQIDIVFELDGAPDLLQEVSITNTSPALVLKVGDHIRVRGHTGLAQIEVVE